MKKLTLALLLLPLAAVGLAGDKTRPAAAVHQVTLNGQTFTLPAGFEIELVAGPPQVLRPIAADFDHEGRLYVADSSGSNEPVNIQLEKKPHRIMRLEDSTGKGRFDRSTVFADKMMFPEGVLWHAGAVYVAAPPSIWKLSGDQREEWFRGKTLTGCANDLHGPYLGPDGWIYWCKGAFAKQVYERPGKKPFATRAAHIFRSRPDGSGIEPVMTGGMDNPVHVVFTPGGERIFTTTFFQHPGGGQRDGLIHAVYGGVYGKDHDVVYEHPWTGPSLMPVLTHLGPAAPCGLLRYESLAFGREYQDNLFACLFNLHKVTRHVLKPDGSTFTSRDEDFLVSSSLDFHPTGVLEDADGSLLVIDTGGWYKLCCPTSQLHKPDLLGAIYRIRRQGAPRPVDPRGLGLEWGKMNPRELARLLDDPRTAVRKRAIETLAARGAEAVAAAADAIHTGSVTARRNAVWVLTRIDDAGARAVVRSALENADESVRQVALHSISVRRDREAVAAVSKLLQGRSLHNRRAAAEALGRLGDRAAVAALLEALAQPADRTLQHSLTFALIELGDRKGVQAALASKDPRQLRAALVALDQMEGGGLEAEAVVPHLLSSDAALKEAASWIVGRHPDWGGALAGFLRDRLGARELSPAERQELAGLLARMSRATAVQALIVEKLRDTRAPRPTRQTALRAMAQSALPQAPVGWVAALAEVLTGGDKELVPEAVSTARALRLPQPHSAKLSAALLAIGSKADADGGTRLAALAAVPGGLARVDPPLFTYLLAQLPPDQPVARRGLAADVLAHAKLSSEQLLRLADAVKDTGPMEVDRLLEAFTLCSDEKVGLRLVTALKASGARSSLRAEALRPRLARFGAPVQQQAEELYKVLDADAAKHKERLDQLLATLKGGDVRRGQSLFNGTKAACSSCHAIGYLGGRVGPDLTKIGGIRSERDLLESIVFPSASLVRSYEPVLVNTRRGKAVNGLVRKDAPDEVVLVTGADQEVRIARDDIEDMQPSKVSVMPAGLDQQLTRQELADLIAFLKACK
jgi:putative membrane-bound dehydrogenase-like protein